MAQATSPAERIQARLAEYLGEHTARVAVKTFSERALGVAPAELRPTDVPRLVDALRPMLRTLAGATRAEQLLSDVAREIR